MEAIHIDLLLALRGAGEFGIGLDHLLTDMRRGRHRDLTRPQAERALRDLADECRANPFTDSLKQKKWAITATGRRALEEASL